MASPGIVNGQMMSNRTNTYRLLCANSRVINNTSLPETWTIFETEQLAICVVTDAD